jgi:3-oxoacyl-[acyl-carrier protein] reductase|tara:strand:+ start:5979 stop:6722 length:744 start_codon:yes stop_codon:yes gene_type:complete
MLLKNKTAIITGCNRGIGKKILETYSKNGATIFACVRELTKEFENLVDTITSTTKKKIIPIQLDFGKEEQVKSAATEILNADIPIDILVNNAGIIHTASFSMTTLKKLKEIFEINFFSQSTFTQYILKSMIKNKKGNILYVSSTSGIDGNMGRSAYSASKAAIISQARVLSKELGAYNIRVNSIAPGLTNTDMMQNNTSKEAIDKFLANVSLKRFANPEEIANAALFLSSDFSSYITGQTIRVDGGI